MADQPHDDVITRGANQVRPAGGRRPGFSLVEVWVGLLVVVAITGVSLAMLRGRTKTVGYRRNRDVLLADVRAMQQSSLVGMTVAVCTAGSSKKICPADGSCACANEVPKGGYGVFLVLCSSGSSPCSYYLFADFDADGNYDYRGSYAASDELLSGGTKTLEPGMTVTQLAPTYQGCIGSDDTRFTATFQPYTGSATLKGNTTCSGYSSSVRLRETIQVGPSSSGVQAIIQRGGGGIQER